MIHPSAAQPPRVCGVPLDDAAIARAAVTIFANTPAPQLACVIAQADPRVAERLRALAVRHGVPPEAA